MSPIPNGTYTYTVYKFNAEIPWLSNLCLAH
jgi:hypothetical protein